MNIVCHPLGNTNNISFDPYPLQFTHTKCVGRKIRTLFPVVKGRDRKLELKGKAKLKILRA